MDRKEGYRIARINNIPDRTFRFRLEKGWSIEDACTKPRYTRVKKVEPYTHKKLRQPKENDNIITYRTKKKEWVY